MRPRKPSELGEPELPPPAANDERAQTLDYLSPTPMPSMVIGTPDIPGYTIERQLGRGGSATVYLARERKHDRLVAVKVLHPALVASLQAQRFLREIEIIARLAHPNILPLLDSGVVGQVLYYVTPYVEGESLRARLEREQKLGLDDAVNVVREVAQALDYAHRQGVIHRDVKPENILLADGHAVVADFGIARAVSAATDHRLTTGDIVGTPLYMSPEQVAAKGGIDGRSDIYGLACVLYELLSGSPPFVGADPQQIIAQHLSDPPPSLRGVTPRVPKSVEWAITVALSKSPADRFATASEFAEALATSGTWLTTAKTAGRLVGRGVPARIGWPVITVAAVIAVAVLALSRGDAAAGSPMQRALTRLGFGEPVLDTTLYVVLPADSSMGLDPAGALRSGLQRWQDISVEDDARVTEMARRHDGGSTPESARDVATALHAGRYVKADVTRAGDSLDVSATLFDARTNQRIKRSQLRVGPDVAAAQAAIGGLVDSVLFREAVSRDRVAGNPGTASVLARQAYLRGHVALANGEFAQADSEFFAAARRDPKFAQSLVWLAMVRSWVQSTARSWAQIPSQAVVQRGDLAAADSAHLDALSAFASGDVARACATWRQLTVTMPNDYASWYALGNCLNKDRAVLGSNGQRYFRSSIKESIAAYGRSFQLRPSILNAFGGRSIDRLRRVLFTSGAFLRIGRSIASDSVQYTGYPVWQGDSLAFIAVPKDRPWEAPAADAVSEALRHQRLRFRDLALMWRAEFPQSADAAEALAASFEMLGDPAALDTLRTARSLAATPADRLRMAVNEAWLGVKFSLPSNVSGLRAARALADSILWTHPVEAGEDAVASLASLIGRADVAAAYARMDAGDPNLPAIARAGPTLLAYAALGGPADSLRELGRIVDIGVQSLPPSTRDAARRDWLTRAATLAFPDYQFTFTSGAPTGLRLGTLISASLVGDTARARKILSDISAERRAAHVSELLPDGLLPEASVLARLGDTRVAASRLDSTLSAVRFTASEDLAFSSQAGSLVRAMVLRADLATKLGDRDSARLWARAVVELWSGADRFLQPTVQRMQQLAR